MRTNSEKQMHGIFMAVIWVISVVALSLKALTDVALPEAAVAMTATWIATTVITTLYFIINTFAGIGDIEDE